MSAEEIKRRILTFAGKKGYFIHPSKSLDDHVKRVIELGGHCPCDPKRPSCPCAECVEEIERGRGACCCTILVSRDYLRYHGYLDKERRLTPFGKRAQ